MPVDQPPPPTSDLFTIAASLGMIPGERIDEMRREADASGFSPGQFALQRGLLDAVELDIVETLAAPDAVIPGYRVLGLIGKGGMGVVYRAEQCNLGRTVALKTILISRMGDKSMLDRFEREARTIGQLRHPNIIAAHDFGRAGGRVYLAMELVEGNDLDRWLKTSGPLNESLAWGLARQCAAGLAHAAQHQTVHRDIKPANLMLVEPPEGYPLPGGMPMVKIADFGLALLQHDAATETRLTAPETTVGSPHYMAPEQFECSDVDIRADMYSLGATVFHALIGRPPFAGLTLSQLVARKLGDGAPRLTSVKPELTAGSCALVHRLLARDRDDRPGDYPTLIGEIDALLARLGGRRAGAVPVAPCPFGSEAAATATTTLHSVQTLKDLPASARRRRRPGVVAAAVGVLVILAGLFAWLGRTPEPRVAGQRGDPLPAGDVLPLFNGRNTAGFRIGFGNWVAIPGEAILSGTDGVIARPLPALAQRSGRGEPAPPRWYRLDLVLHGLDFLTAAAAQEVEFGLSRSDGEQATRYVLRRDAEGVRIGSRTGDRGEFASRPSFSSLSADGADNIAVELERLPTGWFVRVNGRPFASLPVESSPLPEFRLRVDESAQFSDLFLQPLEPST